MERMIAKRLLIVSNRLPVAAHVEAGRAFEVLEGKKVVEVRLRGVSKAVVADQIERTARGGPLVIAIGDDRTDEDLFRALPASSVTVAVGGGATCARFQAADYRAVRTLLRLLLVNAGEVATDSMPA